MSRSPSFTVKTELSPKLNPESLQQWVVAFCIIRFDLEQGQLIEECYPPDCLTQDEELEIALSSFPDSVSQHQNRSSIHDCIFFFRFRRRGDSQLANVSSSENTAVDKELSPKNMDIRNLRRSNTRNNNKASRYMYGYVFNRQRHDERLKRGGEQKSVVILSLSPYSSVFKPLLQIMGPLYFDIGKKALEHIAAYVSMWPAPVPGQLMELPIGNAMLKVSLPPAHSLPLKSGMFFEESVSFMAPLLPNNQSVPQGLFHDSDIFGTFRGLLLQLWVLWELLLIVGSPTISNQPNLAARSSSGKIAVRSQAFGLQQLSLKRFSPSNLLSAVKLRRDGPLCLMTEHKEAIWSTYAATTKPDTSILNRLIDAGMSPRVEESMSLVNNEILRRHFLELTTNFLAPFGPYFRSKTPSEGSSPFVDPPPLSPFNADEFLASLSARGPGKFLSKRMKSNWMDLYRRFLKGANFMPWFQRRRAVAEQEQHKLWRQARMKTDIQQFISKMSELEIVDSFNAIERHLLEELQLQQSGRASADSASSCQKLKGDLRTVFSVLPKDMQQLLLFNPQRAALLQGSSELTKLPGRPLVQVGVVSSTSPR
ncbi:hypothetical protein I3842_15G112200 [Carya illinoinensis]|uniref:UDENN domain-containing protein n=1 Tax=Carya illinoinensis TaxID=32201 RepID=A0A922ADM9_CARIL|nr:hypothetical protein I3842_15G112200 [Carya illinoinensis]